MPDKEIIPALGIDSTLEDSLLLETKETWTRRERSYVLNAFAKTPWAILPRQLIVLEEIVVRHVSGEKLDAEEVETRVHGASRPVTDRRMSAVAVLPLFGTIFPRANLMTQMSGATSAELFGKEFAKLVRDPEVSAIVIDVDSPGGTVDGIEELSNQIYDARGSKPIVAVVDHLMASAAYWIGTAAEEVVISPSGEAGSIGVFAVHEDFSKALDQEGIKVSLISAGKFKVEGNPYEPLAEEAKGAIQSRVNDYYDSFINAVARNRGVNPNAVRNGFGEGRVVGARQAVDLRMADRIGTLDETVDRLLSRNPISNSPGASESSDPMRAAIDPSRSTETDDLLGKSSRAAVDDERQAQRLRDYVQIFK
jgi:signal peptide peptidase SppA